VFHGFAGGVSVEVGYRLFKRQYRRSLKRGEGDLHGTGPFRTRLRIGLDLDLDFC
jgi:hypothetical protein